MFFLLFVWEKIKSLVVQEALRADFSRWGMPQKIRVDNGHPWGSSGDLPPDLALWLLGLGIEVIWNRPHHPQENSRVERSHGVLSPCVEASKCRDISDLQNRIDAAVVMRAREISYERRESSGKESRIVLQHS